MAPPRAIPRFARGHPGLVTPAPTPPTRALIAMARRGRSGQKANPRHSGPLTPPGNHILALFRKPTLCGHSRHCVGRPVSTPWHCAAYSRTVSMSPPSKKDGGTLERGTDAYLTPALDNAVTLDQKSASPLSPLALCGHPRCCITISSITAPSAALWEPGTTRHRHDCCCASTGLPSAAPSSQRTDGNQMGSSRTATLEAAPGRVQGSQRRPTEARFVRTTINSTVLLHTIPPFVALESCGMIVNRLPLAYERRRRSPGRGRGRIDSGALACFRFTTILALHLNQTSGT
jgi:hypothetical protein